MEAGEVKETAGPVEPAAVDEYESACADGTPKVALVGKYADRVSVQLKSRAHLEALEREHGAVEVLP